MSVNAFIAQGIQPVGGDLPRILEMRREGDRRNSMLEMDRENQQFRQQLYGDQQNQLAAENKKAQQEQQMRQSLASVRFALQPGVSKAMIERAVPNVVQGYEQLNGPGSWAAADDSAVKQSAMEAMIKLSSALGQGPPEAAGGGDPYTLGPGSARYGADGSLIAQQPFAPANQTVIQLPSGQAAFNPRTGDLAPLSDRDSQRQAEAADAAAIDTAKAGVAVTSDRSKTATQNSTALSAYEVGMGELAKVFSETDTGPIVGRIPAVTSKQQKAEGAVAAIAPLLKQLFRSAGEGIFTDRDQALLLDMAPKRTDHSDVAQWKIENINAIVRAKLGGGQSAGQAGGNRIRYDANGKRISGN